jgi:transcriptional regulator with XRE-family HTH domain
MPAGEHHRGRPRADAADQKIGDQVRARRLLIGMTQERLGDALGVSFQQVQKYEKGANRISASRLRQIAAALEVPVTHFYDAAEDGFADGRGEGGLNGADGAADPARAGQSLRLVRAFTRIEDAVVRQRLVDLVEGLAASR